MQEIDEGYIKFTPVWKRSAPLPEAVIEDLNKARQELYDCNLIGAYPNGIGFGNISQRIKGTTQFYISGSATGNYAKLTGAHYSKVRSFDLEKNSLTCSGPIVASSESMSHAVIYQVCDWVNAVIHVHHLEYWQKLLHQVPTTDRSATYGSPEMAFSIIDLLKTTNLPETKLFVMEGHREGIFAFGKNLEEAVRIINDQCRMGNEQCRMGNDQ